MECQPWNVSAYRVGRSLRAAQSDLLNLCCTRAPFANENGCCWTTSVVSVELLSLVRPLPLPLRSTHPLLSLDLDRRLLLLRHRLLRPLHVLHEILVALALALVLNLGRPRVLGDELRGGVSAYMNKEGWRCEQEGRRSEQTQSKCGAAISQQVLGNAGDLRSE